MENSQTRSKSHSKSFTRNRNKVRHRLSDAKWRANLARCYGGLRRVVVNNESSCKKKVTKANILKETANHILFLENTIEALMREKAYQNGNHIGPLPWECSLNYFRSCFLAYEEELNKEVSNSERDFTSDISSNSSPPLVRLSVANKNETIAPVTFPQPLYGSFCSDDHCYHLASPMHASSQVSLPFIHLKNNEPSIFEMQKSNKECNVVRRKPLGEISNSFMKTNSRRNFASKTGIGRIEKKLEIREKATHPSQTRSSNGTVSSQLMPTSCYASRKLQCKIKPKCKHNFISGVRRRIFSNIDKNGILCNCKGESDKNVWRVCHNHENMLPGGISENLQCDSSLSNCAMKNPVTDSQTSLQSPRHKPNFHYNCPPTPSKNNKFKDVHSLKRGIRSRRALEKLMNRFAYKGYRNCMEGGANFKTDFNSQQSAKLTEISPFLQKSIQEPEDLSLDNKNFIKGKASREMPKAPLIMKIHKATGCPQENSHEQMTDKKSCSDFLSHNDNSALEYASFRTKDLSKVEETNQEVPDNEIFHKTQSHSCVEVPHLPEVQCHNNGNIVVMLLCKNANRDQEVPKLNETLPCGNGQVKNSLKFAEKVFISPSCKSFQSVGSNNLALQTTEGFHLAQNQLSETSYITKQRRAYEEMLKSSPQETDAKNSNKNSQCFLMQEQDPILTSANFSVKQTSVMDCPQKASLVESPNKNLADNIQYTACQQIGCCWSPCQEPPSSTLFDTGYHEVNE